MATRIVILGGGFAGLYTARHLYRLCRTRPEVEITLISRDNFFQMTPLLFEAGSGILEPRHAVNAIRPMFPRRIVRFIEALVTGIDFDRRVVQTQLMNNESFELPYDHVVIALGGVTNNIVPGSENGLTFKTLADAIYLRNHAIQCFEEADVERNETRKKSLLTFVIVGAGLVGTELQGELSEFLTELCRYYPNIEPAMLRFELLENGARIMPEMDASLAEYATRVYRQRGVNVRVNSPAKSIEPSRITLASGEVIESQTIIVATGVVPAPIVNTFAIDKDNKGRIYVDPTMRCKSRPEVWALGDCAWVPDPSGNRYPALAQHAIREARVLAQNIVAAIDNRPLRPFVYKTLGTLAALGHYKGIANIKSIKLVGFPAWFVWRTYYLLQMPRWSRRLRIILDWTVALLFSYDAVQLNLKREASRELKGEQKISPRSEEKFTST